jgi:hypothetical protein
MRAEDLIAFVTTTEPPGLEIRVNFGIFAGREATPHELDELAHALLPDLGEVTVVSEQRHELTDDVEAAVHQVRVEIEGDRLPSGEAELATLAERLRSTAADWARACIADRAGVGEV